jgi:DNA-binding transcriptional MerR regulator/methylmalonyl-CoA mutase cobalamin-binding subunit
MDETLTGLTIKVVSERTGVSVQTLRAWERRYGVPHPGRSPGNRYRLYDDGDVADVEWMKRQIEAGISPAQASLLLRQQRRPKTAASFASDQPLAAMQSAFQIAVLKSDETGIRQILDEAFELFMPERVALQIIQPAMVELGARWLRNEITVGQEHVASNLVRQKLLSVFHSQPASALSAPYLIAACAPAEEHELGLLILALFLSRQGWRTTYLGQRTPLNDLVDLARAGKPNAVVISVATVIGLASLIPLLMEENRPAAPLVLGGRLLNLLPALRDHMPGAYLGGDAATVAHALGVLTPRATFWAPSKRAWAAVTALRAQRLKIAGEVVAELTQARGSSADRRIYSEQLSFATLYLVDALSCALAFDVPELMDWHREWLKEAMPLRAVSAQALAEHRKAIARVLAKALGAEGGRQFQPLLSRMEGDE